MNRQAKINALRNKGIAVRDDISDSDLDLLFGQHCENNTPPPEVPNAQVPPEDQTPPASVPTETPAAPPAADLVTNGEVTDERALALERREREAAEREARLRETEMSVAEKERKIQEREAALAAPQPAKPKKEKRKRGWSDPVFSNDDEDEE